MRLILDVWRQHVLKVLSDIIGPLLDNNIVGHSDVVGASALALLQLHLHSRLNICLQYIAQLQDVRRNIWVLGIDDLILEMWRYFFQVWVEAVSEQALFMFNFPGLLTLASYNHFHSKIFRNTLIIGALKFIVSLLSAIAFFAIFGYLYTSLRTDPDSVVINGKIKHMGPHLLRWLNLNPSVDSNHMPELHLKFDNG